MWILQTHVSMHTAIDIAYDVDVVEWVGEYSTRVWGECDYAFTDLHLFMHGSDSQQEVNIYTRGNENTAVGKNNKNDCMIVYNFYLFILPHT